MMDNATDYRNLYVRNHVDLHTAAFENAYRDFIRFTLR